MDTRTASTTNGGTARGFEGPFLLLGILPAWPEELERRKDYQGPHAQLTRLLPIAVRPPEIPVPHADPRGEPIGGKNAALVLSRHLSEAFLERLERAVRALSRPRTVAQLARLVGCSSPTTYALLELLRRRGFPLAYGKRGAARTFALLSSTAKK